LAVVLITYFFTHAQLIGEGQSVIKGLAILIISNYIFKAVAALVDTIPFYVGVRILSKYLNIDVMEEFND
jgi:uncharacterized PurR-regulated membrane protein YhhQ (DUF165 family)